MSQKMMVLTIVTCVFVLTTVMYLVHVAPPGLTLLYDMSVNIPARIIQSHDQESNSLAIGQSDWGKEIQTSIGQPENRKEIQTQMDVSDSNKRVLTVQRTPRRDFEKQNSQTNHKEWKVLKQSNIHKEKSMDHSRTNTQTGNVTTNSNNNDKNYNSSLSGNPDTGSNNSATIMFWTYNYLAKFFGRPKDGNWNFDCHPYHCTFTRNRELLADSAALLFDPAFTRGIAMPSFKPAGQRWILQSRESAGKGKITTVMNNKINLKFLYHHISDISWAWGVYIPRGHYESLPFYMPPQHSPEGAKMIKELDIQKEAQKVLYKNLLQSKKSQSLWFISHCKIKRRDRYGKLLKEAGIKIDKFGKCGDPDPCKRKRNCTQAMFLHYKFYIAFENSYCEDYITEKTWKSLQGGMLPIVMGPRIENYEQMLPPDSFLHVDNFTDVSALAEYIKYLDNNDDAYMRYHAWREKYQIVVMNDNTRLVVCHLCKKVHDPPTPEYRHIARWWSRPSQCMSY